MYEQLYAALAAAIREGSLRHGEKLPSKRELCAQLGVSRATVEAAYELLTAEGRMAVSCPAADKMGRATVREHWPTQEISCTVKMRL